MKQLILLLTLLFSFSISWSQIPSAEVKTLEGKTINTNTISNDGKPIVISFWATWCKPCVKELSAIDEVYADWVDETGVKLIAVSIDNARSMKRVAPYVNGKAWEYEILLDPNGEFKRAMNVVNVPHTFIIDGKGKIVYQHTTYATGDEEEVYEILVKLAAGEKID